MAKPNYETVSLPQRRAVTTSYRGPKGQIGGGIQPLAAWVGTYYKDRIGDITVVFAERPKGQEPPTTPVQAEIFFEVDDDFKESTVLPDGLNLRRLPAQTLHYDTYEGPITGLSDALLAWLQGMEQAHELRPGFWQRIVTQQKSPHDPGWEVEYSVVPK